MAGRQGPEEASVAAVAEACPVVAVAEACPVAAVAGAYPVAVAACPVASDGVEVAYAVASGAAWRRPAAASRPRQGIAGDAAGRSADRATASCRRPRKTAVTALREDETVTGGRSLMWWVSWGGEVGRRLGKGWSDSGFGRQRRQRGTAPSDSLGMIELLIDRMDRAV